MLSDACATLFNYLTIFYQDVFNVDCCRFVECEIWYNSTTMTFLLYLHEVYIDPLKDGVVVEHLPHMREIIGLIHGRVVHLRLYKSGLWG